MNCGIMTCKRNVFLRILQNTGNPKGFWGRVVLRGMNVGHAWLSKKSLDFIDWSSDWRVLDIGCGGGANLKRLLKYCRNGSVYGLDASAESVAFAQKLNNKQLGKKCFINVGRAAFLPYDDAFFDAVTAFDTIYFWGDLSVAFNEVARVLKMNGRFLIGCELCNPENRFWCSKIEGMSVYSPEEIERMLLSCGFGNISVYRLRGDSYCFVSQRLEN